MKTIIVLSIFASVAHAGVDPAGRSEFAPLHLRHVPPADAESGSAVELVAEAGAATPTLVAHVRSAGQTQFTAIELVRRDDAHWVAIVPPTAVVTPGIAYYLDAGGEPVFASAEFPQSLPVHDPPESQRKVRDLVRAEQHRSRVHAMGEWVDYGTRTVDGQKLVDNYYRIDGDFSYRLFAYPLEQIRVGYTRLLGETRSMSCPSATPCTTEVGFKVGGWFELGLAPIEGIRFDGRMMVMATSDGFGVGGGGEARLGDRDSSHIALGFEAIQFIGAAGYFRLGWGTVPNLPMSATVEVTNLPAPTRDTGVRLFYDIAREVASGVRIGLRVGYAARVQTVAGITGGFGASVDF